MSRIDSLEKQFYNFKSKFSPSACNFFLIVFILNSVFNTVLFFKQARFVNIH